MHLNKDVELVEEVNKLEWVDINDNFFDMNAGSRRIRVLRGKAGDVKVRSVYDIR